MNLEIIKGKLLIPEEALDAFLQGRGWSWQQLARGDLELSFDDIHLGLICSSPEWWSRAFLVEPDTGDPYIYFPYQVPSLLDEGDVIHSDGAEVGKTREIGNLLLWKSFTKKGASSLVGAPEQVHLDEIIEYCIEQIEDSKVLKPGLKRHKKHPHHVITFQNRAKIYFCPAGFAGVSFRGKHVRDYAFLDEAAKLHNPKIWEEFWRSGKPGCVFRLYSVPDGVRTTNFYRLKEAAKGNVNLQGSDREPDELDGILKERKFTYYNWKKTDQPSPFWTPERQRFYEKLYGGRDSGGYRRNVLGEDGDPENPVFPWHHLEACLKDIPEYKALKLLFDEGSGTVSIFSASYRLNAKGGDKTGKEELLEDRTVSRSGFNLREVIRDAFSPIPGLKYFGGDFGFSNDPTEILVRLIIGKTWRTVARLHMKGATYDLQAEAIDIMDDIFEPKGIGQDFGNAGSALVHMLQAEDAYPEKHYDEKVTGYQFAEAYDDIDENGEVIEDKKTGKPKRKPAKELATGIMQQKMQRREWEMPPDPDLIRSYSSHTYTIGSRNIIYSKVDDHTIDADRACTLKMVIPDETGADMFEGGASFR